MLEICIEIALILRSKKRLMVQLTDFLSGLWVMAMPVIAILITSLTLLFAKGVIPCMHKEQLSDKVTNAQDDFMFLEDVVSLFEFNNERNFVTP